ncbi:hypothetical protein BOO69_11255 [Sulfitobacter alexandrii]|uniref:Uncharacterized protein n=1 Tax=Sulfitobacter alexandrii TaxID=1917485 RepID=A0A1J0WHW9_9RHOB|nr:hypothetical protein BOO69_11255 [Sulfitobacter alexandrii]
MRAGLLGASCLSLAACLGNGNGAAIGGGGGGGGGGPATTRAEYDAKFDQLQNTTSLAPTSVELVGQGTFRGNTLLNVTTNDQAATQGYALGDLEVQADFDNETIAGTATNFRGEIGGNAFTLDGTLDSANGIAPSVLSEQVQPIILPPGVPPIPGAPTEVVTNTFTLNMGGQLADPVSGSIGNVYLGLGGSFLGPIGGGQAQAAVGPATVVVTEQPGGAPIVIGGGGTFVLERD